MCFVFIWEQTATCATYSINWLVFITQMKSVYSAVRTGYLNNAVCGSSLKGWNWFLFLLSVKWNWHSVSSVTLVTKLRAVQRKNITSIPGSTKRLFLPQIFETGSGAHPTSYVMGTVVSLPRDKLPGREADRSTPASAHVKNKWSCTSSLCAFVAWTGVTLPLLYVY